MADAKLRKFQEAGIEETTANVLSKDKKLAEMYEAVSSEVDASLASKWIRRELPRVLNYQKKTLAESGIEPKHMISLLRLISSGKITEKIGQQIINKLGEGPFDVGSYVSKAGLNVVADESEIEKFCKEAIAEAPEAVAEYKAGKEKALNYCVGLVMKKTKGQAKPDVVMKKLKELV
jgi:aspartyl-tRNA(Asn)/glutamyl-tRNA(Gln) amidotransferase subunit B